MLGAVVSIVAGFLPFVSFVAPLLGGVVAGDVYHAGLRDGVGAGALTGVFLAALGILLQILGPTFRRSPQRSSSDPGPVDFGSE
ncbi:DUF5518 domain-containing protein [Halostella sp. JP-L12]|uniref:DUF5518 domain-containing protein n=1 Tax=Halostella TaxID=1843185 RepID=UPI0013CE5BA2|nr:DUF5518 domain-containing protein [Halostella sp. JP-L12]